MDTIIVSAGEEKDIKFNVVTPTVDYALGDLIIFDFAYGNLSYYAVTDCYGIWGYSPY